ncbi:MAG: CapA family protein [Ruminiclostridium sp.]|nr:CapA family protein [Ruminiclostridium sp.]
MKKISTLIAALLILSCGCTNISGEAVPTVQPETSAAPGEAAGKASAETSEEHEAAAEAVIYIDEDKIEAEEEPFQLEPDEPAQSLTANVICAGDNLIHTPIYRIAKETAGGEGYEFSPAYEHLGTLISDADLAILNQETIISDDFEPDTYPTFCTPTEMARDMIELGFDAFSISNNHVLDKGEEGLKSTLNFWLENYPDNPVYGAYLSEEDMNNIRTLDVNGIKFAFLGYMDHTNGIGLMPTSDCKVTYLSNEERIEQQVKKASEIADCVIVSVHFGIEVSNIVCEQQYEMSQKLADWGADIIVGTQPHTVQTMEYLDTADGRKAFVFYCLGNLISTMDVPASMAEMLGKITVTKDPDTGKITLSDAKAIPLVDYFGKSYSYVGVYPLEQYTRELAATHAITGATYDYILGIFRDNIPEEYLDEPYRSIIYSE